MTRNTEQQTDGIAPSAMITRTKAATIALVLVFMTMVTSCLVGLNLIGRFYVDPQIGLGWGWGHGWPFVFLTRETVYPANVIRPPNPMPTLIETSRWPFDGAKIQDFFPSRLVGNVLFATVTLWGSTTMFARWIRSKRPGYRFTVTALAACTAWGATWIALLQSSDEDYIESLFHTLRLVMVVITLMSWYSVLTGISTVVGSTIASFRRGEIGGVSERKNSE